MVSNMAYPAHASRSLLSSLYTRVRIYVRYIVSYDLTGSQWRHHLTKFVRASNALAVYSVGVYADVDGLKKSLASHAGKTADDLRKSGQALNGTPLLSPVVYE